MLLSVATTGAVFLVVKILANTVTPKLERAYLRELSHASAQDSWMTEWANMLADSVLWEWLIVLAVFWALIGLFGKGPRVPSLASLVMLAAAFGPGFYVVLNAIFDGFSWSCFEVRDTHIAFQFSKALECSSREISREVLVWSPLVLAVAAGILGAIHTRKDRQELARSQ